MTAHTTIEMLRRGFECADAAEWRRKAARCAWVKKTMAALRKAQREMDDICMAAVDQLTEEEFERLVDEEQAKVDAIRAPIDAVIERNEWPKHLYWGEI